MIAFIQELKTRNETLFYYGIICLALAFVFLLLTKITTTQVYNVNAFYKPFKFALSTFFFSWAMSWYCFYLPNFNINIFNWSVIILLGFEIIYIAIKASQGQLLHYNLSTPFHSFMYSIMALAATLVTIYTAYIGFLFCTTQFPELPNYYVLAIRLSLIIFVIFSFEGFAMGSKLTHTIGALDGTEGIPILNWSLKHGDLRIAHFIGMHALQVLPIVSFYILKNTKATLVLSIFYLTLAIYTLLLALQGKSLMK
jgi:hypothetical protein